MLVAIPFCTRQDMQTIATLIKEQDTPKPQSAAMSASQQTAPFENLVEEEHPPTANNAPIPFEEIRKKSAGTVPKVIRPGQLTLEMLQDQLAALKQRYPKLTQAEIAAEAGISASLLSKILNGQRPLKEEYQWRLSEVLHRYRKQEKRAMGWLDEHVEPRKH